MSGRVQHILTDEILNRLLQTGGTLACYAYPDGYGGLWDGNNKYLMRRQHKRRAVKDGAMYVVRVRVKQNALIPV